MNAAIAAAIRQAPELWLLDGPEPADPAALEIHGLARVGPCAPVRSAVDAPLSLCALRRVREVPWPPPEPDEPDGPEESERPGEPDGDAAR